VPTARYRLLDQQTRGAILVLRRKGHSLRRISQLLSLSRQTVKKVIKIGSDVPPVIHRLCKLDAHHERIAQMLAEFDGSVVKVRRALADAGTSVGYSTLTRFCRKNHLLDGAPRAMRGEVRPYRKRSVVETRQWLLELMNGAYSGERFQSQLPHTADLRFLLSQLKHGRSRHRKKAATILARKRGISNSVIAAGDDSPGHPDTQLLDAGRSLSSRCACNADISLGGAARRIRFIDKSAG
jgi:hypothetical protein